MPYAIAIVNFALFYSWFALCIYYTLWWAPLYIYFGLYATIASHELGHAAAIICTGNRIRLLSLGQITVRLRKIFPIVEIGLIPIGGAVYTDECNNPVWKRFVNTLGGVAGNMFAGAAGLFSGTTFGTLSATLMAVYIMLTLTPPARQEQGHLTDYGRFALYYRFWRRFRRERQFPAHA